MEIINDLVAKTSDDGYSCNIRNVQSTGNEMVVVNKGRRNSIPEHVPVEQDVLMKWKIYVESPGSKIFDLSYNSRNENLKCKVILRADTSEIPNILK